MPASTSTRHHLAESAVGKPAPRSSPVSSRLVDGELEVGKARDAERIPPDDLHPGERARQDWPDHLLQRNELWGRRGRIPIAADSSEPDAGQNARRRVNGREHDGDGQGQIRDVWKWMSRIDRQGVRTGKTGTRSIDRSHSIPPESDRGMSRRWTSILGQLRQHAGETRPLSNDRADRLRDGSRPADRAGVSRRRREGDTRHHLPPSPATRTMKNSSRVRAEDREELHPLEQRNARIIGFVKNVAR